MSAGRGASGLCGVLLIDKPAGLTSHDVVARVRRATGERRVGHAGTLDPAATGLLVVLVGPYTRLAPYLSAVSKSYEAVIEFGAETDTDDADGTITSTAPVPDSVLDESAARGLLGGIIGESTQVPPRFSAIKVGGRTAHRAARAGDSLELAARPITIERADLLGIEQDPPRWLIAFTVSKGTYIRAIARDMGRLLSTAAHLASLRRTSCGSLRLEQAHTLDSVESCRDVAAVEALFADAIAAAGLPTVQADPRDVACGKKLQAAQHDVDRVSVITRGKLIAVYRRNDDALVPEAVFPVLPEMTS